MIFRTVRERLLLSFVTINRIPRFKKKKRKTYRFLATRVWAKWSTVPIEFDRWTVPVVRNQSLRPCRPAKPTWEKSAGLYAKQTRVCRRRCPLWRVANSFCRWWAPRDGCPRDCPDTIERVLCPSSVWTRRICLAKVTCYKRIKINKKTLSRPW